MDPVSQFKSERAADITAMAEDEELRQKSIDWMLHADGTARVQTVTSSDNPDFHKTLCGFQQLSGFPVLVNTSFNVNGEAIVEYPIDAIESFLFMDIDYLAIGDF